MHCIHFLCFFRYEADAETNEYEEAEEEDAQRLINARYILINHSLRLNYLIINCRSEDSRSFSSKSPLLSRENGASKRSLSECGSQAASTADVHSELINLAQEMRSLVKNLEKTSKTQGTQTEPKTISWVSSPSII
jgi:hypothetical protein